MKIAIDKTKKTVTITLDLLETPVVSSTGDTSAIAEKVNNQATGLKTEDGKDIKLSVNVYTKNPKAPKA